MTICILILQFECFASAVIGDGREYQQTGVPTSTVSSQNDSIPAWLKGNFTDDYRISYAIGDSLWVQQGAIIYHAVKWNLEEQYLIAKNDSVNPSEKGLYSRIDFMQFEGMEPYRWGFCLTVYDALSAESAEKNKPADRSNPRKGCNGFPFSRMKRSQPNP